MPHPLAERCQKIVEGGRCMNQAVKSRTFCSQHEVPGRYDTWRGNVFPTGAITRKQITIKFYLKDGEDPEDVRGRLSDIFRWRDGLTVAVEEKKL